MFDRIRKKLQGGTRTRRRIFERVHAARAWGDEETISGPGSTAARTESIRRHLPRILKSIDARSLLDAPCGDYNWMRLMSLDLDRYIGVDIVPEIIARNQREFGSECVQFLRRDIARDRLPQCDVILCRDCLVHLSFEEVFATLRNFRGTGAKYLLTTTFADHEKNMDVATGDWRQLNLQRPPFSFPRPLEAIDEEWGDGLFVDKRLALWEFEELVSPGDDAGSNRTTR
ncbi:MAG: class I SAM-dependent methyltransferase [Chthoniobacterales bacterium]